MIEIVTPEETILTSSPAPRDRAGPTLPAGAARGIAAAYYRLWHASDLLQGFSEGIDGDRLAAVIEWARDGVAHDSETLIRAFSAWHQAAIDEGAWEGDPVAAARADIERISYAALGLQRSWASVERLFIERMRQVGEEGWSPEHDDGHADFDMARAAAAYCLRTAIDWREQEGLDSEGLNETAEYAWPWSPEWWKPRGADDNLIRAGALILAELDRLARRDGVQAYANAVRTAEADPAIVSQGADVDPDAKGARYGVTASTDHSTVQRCDAWFTDPGKAVAWAGWMNLGAVWDLVEGKVIWPETAR